jgi:hypothetical protein
VGCEDHPLAFGLLSSVLPLPIAILELLLVLLGLLQLLEKAWFLLFPVTTWSIFAIFELRGVNFFLFLLLALKHWDNTLVLTPLLRLLLPLSMVLVVLPK